MFKILKKVEFSPEENKMRSVADTPMPHKSLIQNLAI